MIRETKNNDLSQGLVNKKTDKKSIPIVSQVLIANLKKVAPHITGQSKPLSNGLFLIRLR